jgi:collagenase-like PrtC family protease
VLSTLNLIESESELVGVRRICENGRYNVEANDMSAVQFLSDQQLPFFTGPSVNIYNGRTLDFLARKQLQRWVLPLELGKKDLQAIRDESALKPEAEVFGYGYLPLAYSARCFTARFRNLPKDDCQFVCQDYPSGLPLRSQESQVLFNLNGIQTQSGEKINLLEEVPAMEALGVGVVRISPVIDLEEMSSVIAAFDLARNGERAPALDQESYCNGYWFGQPGMLHAGQTGLLN